MNFNLIGLVRQASNAIFANNNKETALAEWAQDTFAKEDKSGVSFKFDWAEIKKEGKTLDMTDTQIDKVIEKLKKISVLKKEAGKPTAKIYFKDHVGMAGEGITKIDVDGEAETVNEFFQTLVENISQDYPDYIDNNVSVYIGNQTVWTYDIMFDADPKVDLDKYEKWLDENYKIEFIKETEGSLKKEADINWKCPYCGNEETEEGDVNYDSELGMNVITCPYCGRSGTIDKFQIHKKSSLKKEAALRVFFPDAARGAVKKMLEQYPHARCFIEDNWLIMHDEAFDSFQEELKEIIGKDLHVAKASLNIQAKNNRYVEKGNVVSLDLYGDGITIEVALSEDGIYEKAKDSRDIDTDDIVHGVQLQDGGGWKAGHEVSIPVSEIERVVRKTSSLNKEATKFKVGDRVETLVDVDQEDVLYRAGIHGTIATIDSDGYGVTSDRWEDTYYFAEDELKKIASLNRNADKSISDQINDIEQTIWGSDNQQAIDEWDREALKVLDRASKEYWEDAIKNDNRVEEIIDFGIELMKKYNIEYPTRRGELNMNHSIEASAYTDFVKKYFKEHPGSKFKDIAKAWNASKKKAPKKQAWLNEASLNIEASAYTDFVSKYFKSHPGAKFKDIAKAWRAMKKTPKKKAWLTKADVNDNPSAITQDTLHINADDLAVGDRVEVINTGEKGIVKEIASLHGINVYLVMFENNVEWTYHRPYLKKISSLNKDCPDCKSKIAKGKDVEFRYEIEGIGQGHYYLSLLDCLTKAKEESAKHPEDIYKIEQWSPERKEIMRLQGGKEIKASLSEFQYKNLKVGDIITRDDQNKGIEYKITKIHPTMGVAKNNDGSWSKAEQNLYGLMQAKIISKASLKRKAYDPSWGEYQISEDKGELALFKKIKEQATKAMDNVVEIMSKKNLIVERVSYKKIIVEQKDLFDGFIVIELYNFATGPTKDFVENAEPMFAISSTVVPKGETDRTKWKGDVSSAMSISELETKINEQLEYVKSVTKESPTHRWQEKASLKKKSENPQGEAVGEGSDSMPRDRFIKDADKEIQAKIKKLPNGKYQVVAESGRNMGTYDTEKEAKKRLNQIEKFKHMKKASLNRTEWELVNEAVAKVIANFKKITGIEPWKTIDPEGQFYQEVIGMTMDPIIEYLKKNFPDMIEDEKIKYEEFLYRMDEELMSYADEAVEVYKKEHGKYPEPASLRTAADEMHKDVQELMEAGIDIEDLKKMHSYITDADGKKWKFKSSYKNPVGVEVLVLQNFASLNKNAQDDELSEEDKAIIEKGKELLEELKHNETILDINTYDQSDLMELVGSNNIDKIGAHVDDAFEWDIKLGIVNIPEKAREKLTDEQIGNIWWEEASIQIKMLGDDIIDTYSWAENYYQEGRSGGWFCITADLSKLRNNIDDFQTFTDDLEKAIENEDIGEIENYIDRDYKTAEKLGKDIIKQINVVERDLVKIKSQVKATVDGYIDNMESEKFWEQFYDEETKASLNKTSAFDVNKYFEWIQKNVVDKGLVPSVGMTDFALVENFPELDPKAPNVSKTWYAKQVVEKFLKKAQYSMDEIKTLDGLPTFADETFKDLSDTELEERKRKLIENAKESSDREFCEKVDEELKKIENEKKRRVKSSLNREAYKGKYKIKDINVDCEVIDESGNGKTVKVRYIDPITNKVKSKWFDREMIVRIDEDLPPVKAEGGEEVSYSRYGWVIDKDLVDGKDVRLIGPSDISPEIEERLKKGEGHNFKMYDDDHELYYEGRGINCEEDEPLDDFGMPNAGATSMIWEGESTPRTGSLEVEAINKFKVGDKVTDIVHYNTGKIVSVNTNNTYDVRFTSELGIWHEETIPENELIKYDPSKASLNKEANAKVLVYAGDYKVVEHSSTTDKYSYTGEVRNLEEDEPGTLVREFIEETDDSNVKLDSDGTIIEVSSNDFQFAEKKSSLIIEGADLSQLYNESYINYINELKEKGLPEDDAIIKALEVTFPEMVEPIKKQKSEKSLIEYVKTLLHPKAKLDMKAISAKLNIPEEKPIVDTMNYCEEFILKEHGLDILNMFKFRLNASLDETIKQFNMVKEETEIVEALYDKYEQTFIRKADDEEFDDNDDFDPDEVEVGDYVDFGDYGKLYVVNLDAGSTREGMWWVTDLEEDRNNKDARGWYISKRKARRIIEKGE